MTTIETIGAASRLRAWYVASAERFRSSSHEEILGEIAKNSGFDDVLLQKDAWLAQIDFLRDRLRGLDGSILFEFNIPRMGRRIDVVLLTAGIVFAIEFKIGESSYRETAVEQAWDYALDLKNFHAPSHNLTIAPILVATNAPDRVMALVRDDDGVLRPLLANARTFSDAIDAVKSNFAAAPIDLERWLTGSYRPTPTIIEAARALYAHHSVEEIARHDAGAENLRVTSQRVEELVAEAKRTGQKRICFVTGVPGAGKTLVGLNVATRRSDDDPTSPAVYLSGNGPLVDVLREALARDECERLAARNIKARKGPIRSKVSSFIQNVHHFRDDMLRNDQAAPVEHVAIFDEAQRAWTREKAESWMKTKKKVTFQHSEPEFLLSSMDRHQDWSVVVCLVGGGQEINTGEAGIDEWLDAVSAGFPDWRMHISSRLTDSEYAAGRALDRVRNRPFTNLDDCLHLGVSMRSFRAENVSSFVKAVLDHDLHGATAALYGMNGRYPIVITRDLDAAKEWVRQRSRGSERYGLVTSSKAYRLKPHAIDVRVNVDPVHWFLDGKDDIRSSYYLEDAATEFQVQGLELDWTCVTWDGDLRVNDGAWRYHDFRGNRWTNVNSAENRRYLLNAYRVLLTRARQGMVIFVPPGNASDLTRPPKYYDETFTYLQRAGLRSID